MSVDFINLHNYCNKDCYNEKAKSNFYKYLKSWRVWLDNDLNLSLPIWITEYGCINQDGDTNLKFMQNTNDIVFGNGEYYNLKIKRFAWYSQRTFYRMFKESSLINDKNRLTKLGVYYKDID